MRQKPMYRTVSKRTISKVHTQLTGGPNPRTTSQGDKNPGGQIHRRTLICSRLATESSVLAVDWSRLSTR